MLFDFKKTLPLSQVWEELLLLIMGKNGRA